MFFRKTRTIVLCFLAGTILFIIIAVTDAGFPYQAKSTPQRFSLIVSPTYSQVFVKYFRLRFRLQHAHRRLHNADGTTRTDENGIYIYPQDRRYNTADGMSSATNQ